LKEMRRQRDQPGLEAGPDWQFRLLPAVPAARRASWPLSGMLNPAVHSTAIVAVCSPRASSLATMLDKVLGAE
jgi:hypothetical protein